MKFEYKNRKNYAIYFVDGIRISEKKSCKVRWNNGITESLKVVERMVDSYVNYFDNGGYPTSTTVYLDAEIVFNGNLLTVPLEQLPLVVS